MSPTQAKPKNKPHADPAFGIFVEKDAEVRADFGGGFEDEDGRAGRALGALGEQGMARQGGWKGDRRLKGQTEDSGEREKGFELKINTGHSWCPGQKGHWHSQRLNIVNKTSKNNNKIQN